MSDIVQLTQLTGDYSDNDLEALQEIYGMNYRGSVQDFDEGYYLIAFTFPRNGCADRAKDGLRYVWVSEDDLELV